MALRAVVDSIDSVDEAHRDLYAEKDGKFVLEVDDIEAHPKTIALKSALDRVRSEKRAVSEKLTSAEEKLSGVPDDFDADEYARLKENGDKAVKIDERLERQKQQLDQKHGADLKKKDERIGALEGQVRKALIEDGLTKALAEAGISQKHLAVTRSHLKERVKLIEEDGEFRAVVETDINPQTPLAQFVKDWAGSDEGKVYVEPASGADSKGGKGGQTDVNPWAKDSYNVTAQGNIVRDALDAKSPTRVSSESRAKRLMKAAGLTDAQVAQRLGQAA